MSIKNFVRNMLGSIGTDKISDDIDVTKQALTDSTLPAYEQAVESNHFTKNKKLYSGWVVRRDKDFRRVVPRNKGSLVETILYTLRTINGHLDWLRKDFSGTEEIVRDGITYDRAAVLEFQRALSFYVEYSRSLLLAIYAYEIPELLKDKGADSFPYSKVEVLKLEQNFGLFLKVMSILLSHERDLQRILKAVPAVTVDLHDDSAEAVLGSSKVDPLRMGFRSDWNPIWFVASAYAEWQVWRYDAAKQEKKALDLRIMQLKALEAGTQDPSLEKQIEYNENRVRELNYRISKMEAEYVQ